MAIPGFSQSFEATQGAKSKWIWTFKKKKKVEGREYSLADGVFYSSVEWGEAEELTSVPDTCSPPPKSKAVRVYHGHSRPDLCLHRHLIINAS